MHCDILVFLALQFYANYVTYICARLYYVVNYAFACSFLIFINASISWNRSALQSARNIPQNRTHGVLCKAMQIEETRPWSNLSIFSFYICAHSPWHNAFSLNLPLLCNYLCIRAMMATLFCSPRKKRKNKKTHKRATRRWKRTRRKGCNKLHAAWKKNL
jgi:hypothetical protein